MDEDKDIIYDNAKKSLDSKLYVNKVDVWDETLRDGEQAPGVHFTIDNKVEIAKLLSEMGVKVIDVGMPIISAPERTAIKVIARENLDADIGVTVRANQEDIDYAIKCGVDRVHLFYPVSKLHLKYKMNDQTQEQARETILKNLDYIKEQGLRVDYIPEDLSRTYPNFSIELLKEIKPDVESIMICDTVSYLLPLSTYDFTRKIIEGVGDDVKYGCHMHNDFGLATGNTLEAIFAGAELPTLTVNGIGERSGNASLEEVVSALKRVGVKTDIKTEKLKELSDLVIRYSGIIPAPNKPIVGRNSFLHESGVHAAAVLKKTETYEPINAIDIGQQSGFVVGKHSGREQIRRKLADHKIEATDEQVDEILRRIKIKRVADPMDIEEQIKATGYYYARFFGIPERDFKDIAYDVINQKSNNRYKKA